MKVKSFAMVLILAAMLHVAWLKSEAQVKYEKGKPAAQLGISVWHLQTESYALQIYDHNEVVVTIDMQGKVTLGKGITTDEGSQRFWDTLEKYIGKHLESQCQPIEPIIED